MLGEQVHGVASGSLGESVGGKLRLLSGLLVTEGRTVSVGIDRGASEGSTSGEYIVLYYQTMLAA